MSKYRKIRSWIKLAFITTIILTIIIIMQLLSFANSVTYKLEHIGENTFKVKLKSSNDNDYINIRSVSTNKGKNLIVNYAIVNDIQEQADNVIIDCRLFALVPPVRVILSSVEGNEPVFSDIKAHDAELYIQHLHDAEIVKGYEGNTFKPEGSITRAEFFTMMINALGYEVTKNYSDEFTDLKEHWGKNSVMAAVENNLAKGNGDGTISPDSNITIGQVTLVLDRAYKIKPQKDGIYSKLTNPEHYATSSVKKLLDSEVITLEDSIYKEFNIDRPASRAECATMISRAMVK